MAGVASGKPAIHGANSLWTVVSIIAPCLHVCCVGISQGIDSAVARYGQKPVGDPYRIDPVVNVILDGLPVESRLHPAYVMRAARYGDACNNHNPGQYHADHNKPHDVYYQRARNGCSGRADSPAAPAVAPAVAPWAPPAEPPRSATPSVPHVRATRVGPITTCRAADALGACAGVTTDMRTHTFQSHPEAIALAATRRRKTRARVGASTTAWPCHYYCPALPCPCGLSTLLSNDGQRNAGM